ncbi:uncharacterized protein LOC117122897 isoform X2 [Anneissia japonica]|uniref:uncharacterized protein LOC117122897 isoform X2 n=1 Tax=Anneissia japonica TaxID=1529436 RepID=UPI001425872B|nr:uncharacterized protein LOC117122897 isoform X2 [Anneissia japonica]
MPRDRFKKKKGNNMARHVDSSSISRFRWLIVCLANDITDYELKKAKSLMRDKLGDSKYENIKDTFAFFDELLERKRIHEGDTQLLRHILQKIGRQDLIDELNNYHSEYAIIAKHYNKHLPAYEGPFFGRKDRLEELVRLLQGKRKNAVDIICISGLPGMGKTRLAKEACFNQIEYHELLFINLRELTTTESIFREVMHRLGEDTYLDIGIDILTLELKKYKPKNAGGAVLIFDNADRPLNTPGEGKDDEVYNNFVELIERIIRCGNTHLKVLITTRGSLPRKLCTRYENCVFEVSIKAHELEYDDAGDILKYYAGKETAISNEDLKQLIHLCGKCPLVLKVIGRRLQDQAIPPKKMIEYLKYKSDGITNLEFCDEVNLEACLKDTFYRLPEAQRFRLLRLSTIPGTFTSRAAQVVLGMKSADKVDVKLQLQGLKYRNLIETSIDNDDFNASGIRYGMHLLMRQFLQKIAKDDKSITKHYREAEEKFVHYYLRKLAKIGRMSQKEYKRAMKRKNDDAANFQELLKLLPKQKRVIEDEEWQAISSTVELFYSPKERLQFFTDQRELEQENNNTNKIVEMLAYEGVQMSINNYNYEEILPKFAEAEIMLLKATKKTVVNSNNIFLTSLLYLLSKIKPDRYFAEKYIQNLSDAEKEILVILYHLWGNACTKCGRDLDLANKRMQIAYALVRELNLRNATTARFYSTMATVMQNQYWRQGGNALFKRSKIKAAMEFYTMAYNLKKELTGSENHPDIAVYLASIGGCYYQLKDIENAINSYKKAIVLRDKLQIQYNEAHLRTLRNLALAYRDNGRYEDAIDFGKRCAKSRSELLGDHTDTARIYYLLGLFYAERNHHGDMKAAEQNFEEALRIEEKLWEQGKLHTIDWENLKQKIHDVLTKTGQRSKYRDYKKRFEAEKKSSQRPHNTTHAGSVFILPDKPNEGDKQVATKRTHSASSSVDDRELSEVTSIEGNDESFEGDTQVVNRKRKHGASSFDDDCATSADSILSMTIVEGQGNRKKKRKMR